MNKESKSLPQAIKLIVDRYGKDVLNDVRLVNIISDVVTLDESLAVNNTFREIVKLGYGKKILALVSAKGDINMKILAYAKDIADTKGYKEVIVQYVLYSLSFAVGLCQQPYIRNTRKKSKPVNDKPPRVTHRKISEINNDGFNPYKIIIGLLLSFLLVGGVYLFKYNDSSAEREKYEQRVLSGNNFLSKGDYDNAIESYKEAYSGYNGMNSGSYKDDALDKMDFLVDKLIKEGETDNKSLLQAHRIILSELQLNLDNTDKERIEKKLTYLDNIITERVNNGRNTLITNLSVNNGRLDDSSKVLLSELLELAPNDYWLNFIKNKNNE